MNWVAIIRNRILDNLAAATVSESVKEEIVAQAIADTEAGQPFGASPEESKPETDERLRKPRIGG
jgi:hypothetical protein